MGDCGDEFREVGAGGGGVANHSARNCMDRFVMALP